MKLFSLALLTIFSVFFLVNTVSYGQGKILSFSENKSVENTSESDLFKRAKKSLNKSFSNSNQQLLALEEDVNSYIKGNSMMEFNTKDAQLRTVASGSISFSFEVEIMNNSAELTLSNFKHIPQNSKYDFGQLTTDEECPKKVGGTMKKSRINVWTELKNTAQETASTLLGDFSKGLEQNVEGDVVLGVQKIKETMPSDIKSVGIIILKHELAEIKESPNASSIEKKKIRNKKMHNSLASAANKKLDDIVKKYPYKYVIANSRSELDSLYEKGYKYVLDCIAYDNMKSGNFKSSAKVNYYYELFIRDLSDNSRFILNSNFAERSVYNYNLMILRILQGAID